MKLAVFDCDGTLVDSQFSINACMAEAFRAVGLEAPSIGDVRKVVGLPLAQAIAIVADNEDAPVDEMAAAYSKSWTEMRALGQLSEPLFDGIRRTLDSLKSETWHMGVATGKSMRGLQATLDHHDLHTYFVTLQTADRARGKPDPEMLELAMEETGVGPADTVMIGDTTYDIEMARAAGVLAIGVTWGYHQPQDLKSAGASFIVENTRELRTLLNATEELFS